MDRDRDREGQKGRRWEEIKRKDNRKDNEEGDGKGWRGRRRGWTENVFFYTPPPMNR